MKYRIIGSLVLVLILCGLYVVMEADSVTKSPTLYQVPSNPNDSALKSLSIN